MLGVPKVTFPSSEFSVPLLSKLEITATVHNISNNPLTTVIKWQKNMENINITDTRFIGSTEDLVAPKLIIDKVDLINDHGQFYHCVATNSEGSWTASAKINVHEGMFISYIISNRNLFKYFAVSNDMIQYKLHVIIFSTINQVLNFWSLVIGVNNAIQGNT